MLLSFKILHTNPALPSNTEKVQIHLESASIHHTKAEHHLKDGEYKKAAKHALLAQKYLDMANEHIRTYFPKVETSIPVL
jgi:hypothetical protein